MKACCLAVVLGAITPGSFTARAADDIKDVTTRDAVFDDFKIDSVKVRFYGTTAVVNGLGTVKAHNKDRDLGGQYCWTDVFVKKDGQWKAVAAQVTPLAKKTATH